MSLVVRFVVGSCVWRECVYCLLFTRKLQFIRCLLSLVPMIFTSPLAEKASLWPPNLWRVPSTRNIPITIHSNSKSLARKYQKMKFSSLASAALLLVSSSEAFTPISLSSRLVLSACDIYFCLFYMFLWLWMVLRFSRIRRRKHRKNPFYIPSQATRILKIIWCILWVLSRKCTVWNISVQAKWVMAIGCWTEIKDIIEKIPSIFQKHVVNMSYQ